MTQQSSNHLSDQALNDLLIGEPSEDAEIHLAGCTACRGKVEQFHSDLGLFNQSTLAWSQEASRRAAPLAAPHQSRRLLFAAVSWATAAVLLVATAFPLLHKNQTTQTQATLAPSSLAAPSPLSRDAQIAQDNDLLRAVSAAINPDDQSQLNEYHLWVRPQENRRARSKRGSK